MQSAISAKPVLDYIWDRTPPPMLHCIMQLHQRNGADVIETRLTFRGCAAPKNYEADPFRTLITNLSSNTVTLPDWRTQKIRKSGNHVTVTTQHSCMDRPGAGLMGTCDSFQCDLAKRRRQEALFRLQLLKEVGGVPEHSCIKFLGMR